MLFKISPSSGFDNSYFDIQFSIILDNSYPDSEFKIYFINKEIGSKLDILATSHGIIDENGYLVCKQKGQINGYFNLFNEDKMNTKLEPFSKIDIECNIVFKEKTYTETISFYNESFSVDNSILPFDLNLITKDIDLSKNNPVEFSITADSEKTIHLRIESIDSLNKYDFFVYTKKGMITLQIPQEVLNHELSLYKTVSKQFNFCYMKPHGVNYVNVINEKKIIIDNSRIRFFNRLELFPQTRLDPIGKEMDNKEFIISDRYFVPTYKEYTFYSKIKQDSDRSKFSKLLKDELSLIKKEKSSVNAYSWKKEEERPIKEFILPNFTFYSVINNVYNQKTSSYSSFEQKQKSESVDLAKKPGCSECSRKKQGVN